MLELLLLKSNDHSMMLNELKMKILMTNQIILSHAILIWVFEAQIKPVLNEFRQGSKEGPPDELEANPTSGV